jgi:hypothetical protein
VDIDDYINVGRKLKRRDKDENQRCDDKKSNYSGQ